MKKYRYTFFIICLTLLFAFNSSSAQRVSNPFREDGKLKFINQDGTTAATIYIEIAKTAKEIKRGLMFREKMGYNWGMLFIFQKPDIRVFWMRNTILSLDMIFVSEKGTIINIAKNTKPMTDDLYRSEKPAKYVVEVKAGFCDIFGIKPGARVEVKRVRGFKDSGIQVKQ